MREWYNRHFRARKQKLDPTVEFYFGFKDAGFHPFRTEICTWYWSIITRGRSRNLARWCLTDVRKVFATAINGMLVSNCNYVLQYFRLFYSGYFFDDKDKLSLEVVCSEEERDWEAAWEACINPEGDKFIKKTRQKSKCFSFSSDRFCPNPPARPSNGGLSDWNEGDPPRNYQACL